MRVITKSKGNYWKSGRGNFDSVELRYIPDSAARTQTLISGQIDAANRLSLRTLFRDYGYRPQRSLSFEKAGLRFKLPADTSEVKKQKRGRRIDQGELERP